MSDIALWCMVALNTFCLAVTMREVKRLRVLVQMHRDAIRTINAAMIAKLKADRFMRDVEDT